MVKGRCPCHGLIAQALDIMMPVSYHRKEAELFYFVPWVGEAVSWELGSDQLPLSMLTSSSLHAQVTHCVELTLSPAPCLDHVRFHLHSIL